MGIVVEGPRFVLLDPDTDQLAGNVMALREPMKRLTPEVLLDDLPLELEAVGSVLSRHRLFSRSPTPGSNNLIPRVRPKGPTPAPGHFSTTINSMTSRRLSIFATTGLSVLSTAWTWNTCLARSRPTVATVVKSGDCLLMNSAPVLDRFDSDTAWQREPPNQSPIRAPSTPSPHTASPTRCTLIRKTSSA